MFPLRDKHTGINEMSELNNLENSNTNFAPYYSALRAILIAGGGFLVSKGYVDNSTLITIVGIIMTLVTAVVGILTHTTSSQISNVANVTGVSKKSIVSNIVSQKVGLNR